MEIYIDKTVAVIYICGVIVMLGITISNALSRYAKRAKTPLEIYIIALILTMGSWLTVVLLLLGMSAVRKEIEEKQKKMVKDLDDIIAELKAKTETKPE